MKSIDDKQSLNKSIHLYQFLSFILMEGADKTVVFPFFFILVRETLQIKDENRHQMITKEMQNHFQIAILHF
jgi:hypothetical protein